MTRWRTPPHRSGAEVFHSDHIVAAARAAGAGRADVLQRCEALLHDAKARGQPERHVHTAEAQRARPAPSWTQGASLILGATVILYFFFLLGEALPTDADLRRTNG